MQELETLLEGAPEYTTTATDDRYAGGLYSFVNQPVNFEPIITPMNNQTTLYDYGFQRNRIPLEGNSFLDLNKSSRNTYIIGQETPELPGFRINTYIHHDRGPGRMTEF